MQLVSKIVYSFAVLTDELPRYAGKSRPEMQSVAPELPAVIFAMLL